MVVVSDSVGPACQGVILPCEHGLDPAGRTSCRSYRPTVIQYESSPRAITPARLYVPLPRDMVIGVRTGGCSPYSWHHIVDLTARKSAQTRI